VHPDASHELDDGLVVAGSDAGGLEDFLTELGVADTESELLLLGRFGLGQLAGEEVR
jgi:hypothetical protein